MNASAMAKMSAAELDAYAKHLGLNVSAETTVEGKVRAIQRRRERVATIEVLGTELSIPIKNMGDLRFTGIVNNVRRTTDELMQAFAMLLGEKQHKELIKAATDEDGVIDEPALSFAYCAILDSSELKNF